VILELVKEWGWLVGLILMFGWEAAERRHKERRRWERRKAGDRRLQADRRRR